MKRNFGNPSGPIRLGGASADRSAFSARSTRANTEFDERTRERAALSFATVVFSLVFAIPMILVGVILHFH